MIPCANPKAQYESHRAAIDEAFRRVLESGWYVLGEEVRQFETEFAGYIGTTDAIGVGSGTDALHLALAASGIGLGDEVVTVSHTAVATVAAIEQAGATPVLVDIDPATFTMDAGQFEALVSPATRAVIPVHLYGQPADMAPILEIARRHQLRVIEDCAQAHGARYRGQPAGSLGDIGCFSFYPTKNLGAIGDGGMVVTSDPALARQARLLREYGWAERYVSHTTGWNSRLDELQAAGLRVKLQTLDEDNCKRAAIAALYDEGLAGLDLALPKRNPDSTHVFHLYVVRTSRRDALQAFLRTKEIGTLIHYPVPVHEQPAYRGRLRGSGRLPHTERAAREVLSLPMYPELSHDDVRAVIAALRQFFEENR